MQLTGQERLKKEFLNFLLKRPSGSWGELINSNDYTKWRIHFYGPEKSDYEDGLFNVRLVFKNFPDNPPDCYFELLL